MIDRWNTVVPFKSEQIPEVQAYLLSLAAKVKTIGSIPLHLGHALAGTVIHTVTFGNYYKGVGPDQWALAKQAIENADFVSLVVGSTLAFYSAQTYRSFWQTHSEIDEENTFKKFSFPVACLLKLSDKLRVFVPYISSTDTARLIAKSNETFDTNKNPTPEDYKKNRSEVASLHRWQAIGNLVQIMAFYRLKQQYAFCTIPYYLLCAERVRNFFAMVQNYRTTHIKEDHFQAGGMEATFQKYCDRNGKYIDFSMWGRAFDERKN